MIAWILANPRIAGSLALVLVVLGVLGFVYYKGGSDERDHQAGKTLEQIQRESRERDAIEERNRGLSDSDSTERLRPHR